MSSSERDSPKKYLRNITRTEEIVDMLNTLLALRKSAEVTLYPVFVDEIMDVLIDMKTIVEQYAAEYEQLEDENTRLRYITEQNNQ